MITYENSDCTGWKVLAPKARNRIVSDPQHRITTAHGHGDGQGLEAGRTRGDEHFYPELGGLRAKRAMNRLQQRVVLGVDTLVSAYPLLPEACSSSSADDEPSADWLGGGSSDSASLESVDGGGARGTVGSRPSVDTRRSPTLCVF